MTIKIITNNDLSEYANVLYSLNQKYDQKFFITNELNLEAELNRRISNGTKYFIFLVKQNVAGLIILNGEEIMHIFVDPNYRGQKIASKLIDNVKLEKDNLFLFISKVNEVGISFYKTNDFKINNKYKSEVSYKMYWKKN